MADWNQIVSDYEAKIVELEAKVKTYSEAKVRGAESILITSGVAFVLGFLIGLSL